MKRVTFAGLVLLLGGCSTPAHEHSWLADARWQPLETGSRASLRGVCAPGDGVVWASGSDATVLRSLDGGASWTVLRVPGPVTSDFRDVEALDAERAWIMSVTEPARILFTEDGGATWSERHVGRVGAFFDSLARFDGGSVVLFGDPIDGVFDIAGTEDGTAWMPADSAPPAHEGEAAFAASGRCGATHGDRHAWIGTGGQRARVLCSTDGGRTWIASETPMRQGAATTGIYAVAFANERRGVVVGGDYTQPEVAGDNAAFTRDGGMTWRSAEAPPHGYRSAVTFLPGSTEVLIAVGRAGGDFSLDGGVTWRPLGDDTGYYALSAAPDGSVLAVGANGRAARLVLTGADAHAR